MSRFCQKCGNPLDEGSSFCNKCGTKTQVFCTACGAENAAGSARCQKCGAVLESTPQAPHLAVRQAPPPLQQTFGSQPGGYAPAPRSQAVYATPGPAKKSHLGLILGLSACGVVLLAAVIIGVSALLHNGKEVPSIKGTQAPSQVQLTPFPTELTVDTSKVQVSCDYVSPEYIIPANYRSLESIVFMQCSADQGSTDLMVEVEIPGFTQKYQQKITVNRSETELRIHPPLLDGAAKSLSSSKDAQLNVSVTDLNSGKIIVQDTKPIKLYSRYDMQWVGDDGTPFDENILAWVTPESEDIRTLLRKSADSCNTLTQGKLDAIVGYQEAVSGWTKEQMTYVQAYCIMHTLAKQDAVRYIASPFSSTDSTLQRIATPSEVIKSKAGLCVETAVTIASALEAQDMHAFLILLPGHCQVAVETWKNSGEYLLIETTALTSAASAYSQSDFDNVIKLTPRTKDEWKAYLAQDGVTAIDCDLAEQLHIQAIN